MVAVAVAVVVAVVGEVVVVAIGVSMKLLGFATRRIEWLRLPGNWPALLSDPDTLRIAKSLELVQQLHEPIVRKRDKLLILGRKRVAAHHLRGETKVVVKLVECTDEEAWTMERVENAARAHDPAAQAAATLELMAKFEQESAKPKAPSGPQETAVGDARKRVAGILGIKPESVRKRIQRTKRPNKEHPTCPETVIANLTTWVVMDPEFEGKVNEVKNVIQRSDNKARAILSDLTALAQSGLPIHTERVGRVYADLREVFDRLRSLMPRSLCPFCKGVESILETCPACLGTQYIVSAQEGGVPERLWDTKDAVVSVNGQLQPLRQFFQGDASPETEDGEDSAPPGEGDGQTILPLAEADDPFGGLPE